VRFTRTVTASARQSTRPGRAGRPRAGVGTSRFELAFTIQKPSPGFLANLVVLLSSHLSGDQFLTWGWRIPFLLSLILVAVGAWIRLGIMETPIFARLVAEEKVERTPLNEVIRQYPKEIVLSAFARLAEQAPARWH
jgi:MFS family permease